MNKEILDLASGLQYSNIPEVAELAKAYIKLYTKIVAEEVLSKHKTLFQRLAESENEID